MLLSAADGGELLLEASNILQAYTATNHIVEIMRRHCALPAQIFECFGTAVKVTCFYAAI
jgi:hypothetical protein